MEKLDLMNQGSTCGARRACTARRCLCGCALAILLCLESGCGGAGSSEGKPADSGSALDAQALVTETNRPVESVAVTNAALGVRTKLPVDPSVQDQTEQDQLWRLPETAGRLESSASKKVDLPPAASPREGSERKPRFAWQSLPPEQHLQLYSDLKPQVEEAKRLLNEAIAEERDAQVDLVPYRLELERHQSKLDEALENSDTLAEFDTLVAAQKQRLQELMSELNQYAALKAEQGMAEQGIGERGSAQGGVEFDEATYRDLLEERDDLMRRLYAAAGMRRELEREMIAGDASLAQSRKMVRTLEGKISRSINNAPRVSAARKKFNKLRDERLSLGRELHSKSNQQDIKTLNSKRQS